MQVRRAPAERLLERVDAYWGFDETTDGPIRRREGPGRSVAVILSFGEEWLIDGERRASFVGGLRMSQVATEHAGRACGLHIELAPWAAHSLFRVSMNELAGTTVPFDQLLSIDLVGRLESAPTWAERFALLDDVLTKRLLEDAPAPPCPKTVWAWERLCTTHGRVRIGALADELGWSRKRLVARFREQIGLPPKAAARLLRFERARTLAGSIGWAELAVSCGYADQPHLISEFRAFTGRSPGALLERGL